MQTAVDRIYPWIVKRRNLWVRCMAAVNVGLGVLWLFGYRAIVLGQGDPRWYSRNSTAFGELAIILYILTTIPGIARRLGMFYKPVSVLMMLRRQIGIMTFMLVLTHASVEWLFPLLLGRAFLIPRVFYQAMGVAAFVLLILLFVTSNDRSVKKLGIWWHRIHNLTYLIAILIFLHVAIQDVNLWSVLIWLDTLAFASSFVVSSRRRRG